MAEDSIKLFGFEIKRARNRQQEKLQSIVPPVDEDGAGYVTAAGEHYGTYVDLDGERSKDETSDVVKKIIRKSFVYILYFFFFFAY